MIKREEKETQTQTREKTEREGLIKALKPLASLIILWVVIIAFSLI